MPPFTEASLTVCCACSDVRWVARGRTVRQHIRLFGGCDAWPIGRIATEWDRNAEAVRALPGHFHT